MPTNENIVPEENSTIIQGTQSGGIETTNNSNNTNDNTIQTIETLQETSDSDGLWDQKGPVQEHTRSKMAILFVIGFFGTIFLCLAYSIKVEATLTELKDALVAIIGALSGTLGFIVGYYYKSNQEK